MSPETTAAQERPALLAGRYRIDGLLGRGGMSEVYHGYDERLDRCVAIKVLRPPSDAPAAPDSPEAVEILDGLERDRKRFLREIRVMAKLELPGMPAVYDTGVHHEPNAPDRLYLVMQLLRGTTVEALLDHADYESAPPPVTWAAAIAAQVAAVLADVHAIDIVHRDVKPANVMVTDGGLVKVLDFGIAILRGSGSLPRLTQVGATIGTPPYMSPEQCLGPVVTPASDVYSLGCLFLELLTGDVPFFGGDEAPLRAQHLNTPAPSARGRRPGIPDPIDALLASMLAKEPGMRPSAAEVYESLLPFTGLTGPNGSAGADRVAGPSLAGADRDPTLPFRRPLLGGADRRRSADAGTGGVPGTGGVSGDAADEAFGKADDAPGPRHGLTKSEALLLADNAFALLESDHPSQAVTLLEDGIARTAGDPALQLQLRHSLGSALFSAGEYTRAASVLDAAGREYLLHFPPDDKFVLDCAYHAGLAYAETGKPREALPQLRFYVQNAPPAAADDVLETRFVIAQLLAAAGEPEEALDELHAVRPLLVEAYGERSVQVRNLDHQANRLTG